MSMCGLKLPAPIVLASSSLRRQQLLRMLGLEPHIAPADIDEDAVRCASPRQYVETLADQKAARMHQSYPDAIVIGADTTVVLDGTILNKPRSADEAGHMLRMLSGRTHTVFTGLAVRWRTFRLVDSRSTRVTFRLLSDDEIAAYVATGSPLDKAGAYGIQDDCGAVFVQHLEGCYYTVVGLPIELLYRMLRIIRNAVP